MGLRCCTCAVLVAAAAVVSMAWARPAAAQRPIKRVLTIHAGAEAYPGNRTLDEVITKILYSHPAIEVDYYAEFLEYEEFGVAADTSLRDYLRVKFRDRPLDALIVDGAPAVQFALQHRAELFPDVPIVFATATTPREVLEGKVARATGVLRGPAHVETLDLALKLHPATKRVQVVAYAPNFDSYQEGVKAALAAFSTRVSLTYSHEPSLPAMLAALKTLPADSLILYARYSPAARGRVIFPDELLPEIAEAAPVPIYSSLDTYIGKGVVGGMMRSDISLATRVGEVTLRILEGAKPEDIPVEAARMSPIFDWRQVQRWGIDPSLLPVASVIMFREPSVWDLYRGYIISGVALVTVQTGLIVGLLVHRARRRRAESELRASLARIRELGRRLLTAQETERTRIARELHDDISQQLAILNLDLHQLAGMAQGPAGTVASEAVKYADNIATSVRNLSHQLYPAKLRLLGLATALKGLVGEFSHHNPSITFTDENVPTSLPPDLALCVFRIVQEALQNALKHSQAKTISVHLTGNSDRLELTVVDDGVGFVVEGVGHEGLGLISLRERVGAMGGQFNVSSSPHRGTRLTVSMPVTMKENSSTTAV